MTRDDIIRMAREAGLTQKPFCRWGGYADDLMRFAALVAAAERGSVGNIILDYAGRDGLSDSDESLLKHLFELIRARGEP